MKPVVIVGVLLIVFGLAGLIAGAVPYKTEQDSVDLGPIEATRTEQKKIVIPPVVSGLAIAAGVVLVFSGAKKSHA